MKNTLVYIVYFGFALLFSCKKEESIMPNSDFEKIFVYSDKNVKEVLSVIPGDGVALIVFTNNNDSASYFKLVKNNGEEIWTKNVSLLIDDFSRIEEVLYNNDNTFSIFLLNRLAIINLNGEITLNNPDFFEAINGYQKLNIKITPSGNYFVVGMVNIGASYRSFYAEFSKAGDLNYRKFFIFNAQGSNSITDAVILPEGGFLLAGSFAPLFSASNHYVFLLRIMDNGDTLWTKRYQVSTTVSNLFGDVVINGREIITNGDNTYSYLFNVINSGASDQRSKIYKFSAEGTLLDTNYLDLSSINYIPLKNPYFGKSISPNKERGYTGICSIAHPPLSIISTNNYSNYNIPHYSYSYSLSNDGNVVNKEFLNKTFTNYFTAIDKLSDGNVIMGGTILSFGKEVRIILIIR